MGEGDDALALLLLASLDCAEDERRGSGSPGMAVALVGLVGRALPLLLAGRLCRLRTLSAVSPGMPHSQGQSS